MGPGNKFVRTQYFATLLRATALRAVVFTRRSVATDVVTGVLCVFYKTKASSVYTEVLTTGLIYKTLFDV